MPRPGHFRAPSILLFLAGCGGTHTEASSTATNEMTPGQKCLVDASAPRDPGSDAPTKITVSHILVRHAELERPQNATLSREDACLKALAALEALGSSGDWNQVVSDFSDSGESTHGNLGQVSRDDVTPQFGDAAFALDVDEVSYVVESDRGFHIILRTR